jgi:ABC-type multidrug transport system fused ATPase/permease subunit
MEQDQTEEYDAKTEDLMVGQVKVGRISALMNPITFVVVNIAVVVLIHVGALKVEGGILTQGLVVALYNYMSQILVELIKMANLIITMTKAVACGNRISDVLEQQTERIGTKVPVSLSGAVTFRDVSLTYDEAQEPSLEHIDFVVEPGQTIGVIGGTGSGKSSLVHLVPGFYPATEGAVLLDGVDVRELNQNVLREKIGIVPQKAVLFKGTIRDNLLWGNADASEEELWEALTVAQAAEVVKGKEGGLDAPVEQGGVNFSGGQRQRLTIARALVRKPSVLILDDSASALDYATDAKLRMAIAGMEHKPTTFIVSQRASSVRFADRILVLEDGLLVGNGTHDELMKSCDVYQEIYYSQFPREVTDNG